MDMERFLILVFGELVVGLSVASMHWIGLWFIVPWVIGWQIYNFGFTPPNR